MEDPGEKVLRFLAWIFSAIRYFIKIIYKKKKSEISTSLNFLIIIFSIQTVNVGQELINEGFAELEENLSSAASSTLSLSNRSHEVTAISTPASTSPLAKRALSPETLTDSPNKLESASELQNTSMIDLKISSNVHGLSQIEEIDLVTPQVNIWIRILINLLKN